MSKFWWLSGTRFTILVETVNDRITKTAPIARKFVGQNINNLIRWGQIDKIEQLR